MKKQVCKCNHAIKSFLIVILFAIPSFVFSQNKNLKVVGHVKIEGDSFGAPGVSVVVKGTNNGTLTDIDGKYELVLSDQSEHVLVYTMIGMTSVDKRVKGGDVVDVIMHEDQRLLDEVVVTGYTTEKKADITGAVSVVKMKDINRLLSPSVTKDKDGLTTAIAIIPDEIGSQAAYEHGWTHLYSIPRVWTIVDGKIRQSPHPQLKKLRKGEMETINAQIEDKKTIKLSSNDQQVEVTVTVDPQDSKRFGFYIHRNADNSEYTKIFYDVEKEQIVVDQRYSSLKKHIPLDVRADKYKLDLSKTVDFHVFVDGSVVEVFINNEDAFTTRIFPLKSESSHLEIFSEGGSIKIQGQTWNLNEAKMNIDF